MFFFVPFFLCNSWGYIVVYFILMFLFFFLNIPLYLNYVIIGLYFDSISFNLRLLTLILFVFIILSRQFVYKNNLIENLYNVYLCLLLLILFYCFLVKNILLFYFLFESSLIPTFILILGWGVQPERLQASIYFFFYTLFISIPLLFIIIILFYWRGDILFGLDYIVRSSSDFYYLIYGIFFLMSFLIKIPVYFFHLWLPKAHVEAPVRGSMILAAVLLKLGSYGICRIFLFIFPLVVKISSYIFRVGLISIVYIGLICCRINDIKALIAYSSVAHIGMLICSLFGFYSIGYLGSLLIIISHGVTSSGLFCLVNLLYERRGRRRIYINKGLSLIIPLFRVFMFLLCASNFSTPPFISLVSEFFLLIRIINYSYSMIFIFFFGSLLGTVFCIYLFSFSSHGKKFNLDVNLISFQGIEYHVVMLHLFLIILMPIILYYLYFIY